MFSSQLDLTLDLVARLQRVVQFLALIYVPAWLAAPFAADAPRNDLVLYQRLLRYKSVDKEIAAAALQVIRRHIWYLRPQTVVFALFSPSVDEAVKDKMAQKLSAVAVPESYPNANVSVDEDTRLPELIDEQSWLLFTKLGQRDPTWLSTPARTWSDDPQYCLMRDTVTSLKVTNDVAERGIKLIEDFTGSVTKSEPQLQSLLQLVERHRRAFPDFRKSTLSGL